jgi:hypothetical protein
MKGSNLSNYSNSRNPFAQAQSEAKPEQQKFDGLPLASIVERI